MDSFHIITPCTRLNNLRTIRNNINGVKKTDVTWHICFDSFNTTEDERNKAKLAFTEPWILFYEAGTSFKNPGKAQINFVLSHFNIGLFEGFIYVLDDDNILPPDFFNYNYKLQESAIYLLPQIRRRILCQPIPKLNCIDQGQFIVHSTKCKFYDLTYDADGKCIEDLCKSNSYKTLSRPITYYNRLNP